MRMGKFVIENTELKDAYLIDNFYRGDERGGFTKYYEENEFVENGIDFHLDEALFSTSAKDVLRGIHFQTKPQQAKIVCVPKGKIYDVIVDLRHDSVTYRKWQGFELSGENHKGLYVPKGFGHGFLTISDAIVLYLCDGKYSSETETGIYAFDEVLAIDWNIEKEKVIQSERDKGLQRFGEYEKKMIVTSS